MHTVLEPAHLRNVLGNYPTGVSVITATAPDGQALAMVVGTFTSVSLEPPLIAFLPQKSSSSFADLRACDRFVVNVLAHDQEDVVRRLSRSDRTKMDAESWHPSPGGAPILDGVVAAIECDFHDVIEAGDHYIALGNVRSLQTVRPTNPLLFFRGGYGEFAAKSIVVPDGRGLSEAVGRAQALRADLEDGARRLGGELTVFARIVSDSVAVASATGAGSETVTALGVRYPVVPPIGALYVAWSPESEQEAWSGKAVGASPAQRAAYHRHLADIRECGWAASFVPDDDGDEGLLPDEITRRMATSAFVLDVRDIEPDRRYRLTGLMAPVFLHGGRAPELMIRQLLYPAVEVTGEVVLQRGAALKAFAEQASARLSTAAAA